MKRPMPLSDNEEDSSSSDESSSSNSDSNVDKTKGRDVSKSNKGHQSKEKKSEGKYGRRKSGAVDFDVLKQHGYKGGMSVLSVPLPKEDTKPDWAWSTGKERREIEAVEESYEQRQKTRAALLDAERLTNVQTSKEKKNLSFSQKEKRKRDLGQASRGKNFVEEEKRLSRESGIYSGFDT
ncbi:hypothetical protein JCGZ_21891 [Jatropha curcas]|uniref:Uncharacterized protein n=1 Tax=Jatropha curcas TaxID=180498 RepID=A0A067JN21_JATCU|nr:uncharacterized protein LOC105649957 [Jatropha curcas]XP_037492508.1 uncharacterized protein LOC105649957 [Jatropha curcas]KDP21420.1 hypothetical protein JCGZ_21891 [Jatropha curcas]